MMHYLSRAYKSKISGKTALVRVDLNIKDADLRGFKNGLTRMTPYRVEAIIPTIQYLLKNKAKVVLLSHRGQPEIPNNKFQITNKSQIQNLKKFTLKPFAKILSEKLEESVVFISDSDFKTVKEKIGKSQNRIFLLENLRFWSGEEKNDAKFAKRLASLGDFYVNDAFAVSHRKNASVVAITRFLPPYASPLLEREIKNLDKVIKSHRHGPFTIIIGGAKVSDKIGVIKNFWDKADYFLLGGGPANTFFAALDFPVGKSLIDKSQSVSWRTNLQEYLNSKKIILPSDVKIKDRKILDIGEQTVKNYSEIIKKSKTIIWNGPMGLFEKKGFAGGTKGVWQAILKNKKAIIIVGGGETVASLQLITNNLKLKTKNLFLSTGGGAMLEYLSGKKLLGIEALKN